MRDKELLRQLFYNCANDVTRVRNTLEVSWGFFFKLSSFNPFSLSFLPSFPSLCLDLHSWSLRNHHQHFIQRLREGLSWPIPLGTWRNDSRTPDTGSLTKHFWDGVQHSKSTSSGGRQAWVFIPLTCTIWILSLSFQMYKIELKIILSSWYLEHMLSTCQVLWKISSVHYLI